MDTEFSDVLISPESYVEEFCRHPLITPEKIRPILTPDCSLYRDAPLAVQIANVYFRPLLSEQTRIGYLYSMGIPLRDFTEYFKNITDQLLKQIEDNAAELGRPVVYLNSAKEKKEDIAKGFLRSAPVDEGLICAIKTLDLADKFDSSKLCRLDSFARSISPFLDTVQNQFGQGYFWCVDQCEFATDIMFKERSF